MERGEIPRSGNRLGFGPRQSSRGSTIKKGSISELILTPFLSLNPGALTQPKFQPVAQSWYTWRILLCVICAGLLLYSHIDAQNALTRLRLQIPVISREIIDLKEENTHLTYEIKLFESPQHLLELAAHSEFSHLKQPLLKEIITMPQGVALQVSSEETQKVVRERPRLTLAVGAKQ